MLCRSSRRGRRGYLRSINILNKCPNEISLGWCIVSLYLLLVYCAQIRWFSSHIVAVS